MEERFLVKQSYRRRFSISITGLGQAKRYFLQSMIPKFPLISGSFCHPKCKFPWINYTKPTRVNISESSLPVPCPSPTFSTPCPPTPLPKANFIKEKRLQEYQLPRCGNQNVIKKGKIGVCLIGGLCQMPRGGVQEKGPPVYTAGVTHARTLLSSP